MSDRFDEIRAERDLRPIPPSPSGRGQHAGLWKQIALGIVVGYSALALLGALAWGVLGQLALGSLQIALP